MLPTKAQETALQATLALCRDVYNSLVIERAAVYETTGKYLTYREQQNISLKNWKAAHPELSSLHSQVLQNIAVRVDLAFKAFFRRVKSGETPGYPRLKGRGVYDSITFPQAQVTGCKLTCFACEVEPEALPESDQAIGIDVGLNQFAALSDGTFVANPRFFRRDEKALAKAARKQAKTAKGSKPRRKANKVLSRIHERIRNRRHDFVHQFARRLVNRYGLIAVEKLNVKGMVQNHCLSKSISDASWSLFLDGNQTVAVD